MELARIVKQDLDISSEVDTLTYQYDGLRPIEVIIRASLGDEAKPIVGGSIYLLNVYINGVLLTPSSSLPVDPGITRTVLASRPIPIETGEALAVRIRGNPADTAIDVVTTLRDVTSLHASEALGDGSVVVDHDYGGADALAVLVNGTSQPVDNAIIRVYREADFLAGNKGQSYVVGATMTDLNGRWRDQMLLDPGNYVMLVYKQRVIRPKTVRLLVG